MGLSERNGISIAEIIVYSPAFLISILLCIRHGFGRSAGFYFLIIFTLARIVGSALQLATISAPTNISLYIGSLTLQNIALTPLTLLTLAMINRVVVSIEKVETLPVNARMLRFLNLVILVSLILSAIGGSDAGTNYANTGVYVVSPLTKAAIALIIIGFIAIVLVTVLVAFNISSAEPGEKRIVAAVAVCLPFLLVRIIYSAISAFDNPPAFNSFTGSASVYLGLAVIEEIIIVIVMEAVALTLRVIPKEERAASSNSRSGPIGAGRRRRGRRNDAYEMRDRSAV
ncbi:hypothetical protein F5Y16DRAFT_370403 [Xylariaceae sp. FL0255]|nr:hypothetical protein F5Y16DRAFT_370403 [Xylariaceae sp. FL0255]